MSFEIALILIQDGLVNGAIYALLALALVAVFSVTRVIFIPQGEFVAYGGLTLAALQAGRVPGTFWILCATSAAVAASDAIRLARGRSSGSLRHTVLVNIAYPALLGAVLRLVPVAAAPTWAQVVLTLALVVPLGPGVYRLAYEPLAAAPVLVLLVVSVAVHVSLVSLGLLFFGPEGARTLPFSEARFELGRLEVGAQPLLVLLFSAALIAALYAFFEGTARGKALRASAMNRTGARLVGIRPSLTGRWSFALAALIGAASGILIAPITTLYYDTGFLMGLKGFVGAIVGALASYPLAAAGAVLVGLIEAFASFWASAYKELIVFALIIPVLLVRSLHARRVEEDQ
jgi:branched-chain amino acid transport system permease protein